VRGWPTSAEELIEEQSALGEEAPTAWEPGPAFVAGGCFVCFERGPSGPGRAGDRAWAAAAAADLTAAITGAAGAGYESGLLALREGPLLEAAAGTPSPVRRGAPAGQLNSLRPCARADIHYLGSGVIALQQLLEPTNHEPARRAG
jgi:hypothetical protein